jgi:DNA-binding HxlR family transcriptional regulator
MATSAEKTGAPTPAFYCPIETTLSVIGGKWKVVILYRLQAGTRRFGELRRAIPGVSERVLAAQLRELERDGVVRRVVHPEVPPRVEYSLSDYGETLRPLTDLMCTWGKAHSRRLATAAAPDSEQEQEPEPNHAQIAE